MFPSSVRILVLEDFDQFQKRIAPILQQRPNWQIVALATESADAVGLAKELQPDLILLDIDLPRMNGIKAARDIRTVVRESRIVFLSQESSIGLLREVFRFGVWGYVNKEHAPRELISAMEAVLQGRHFIGSGGAGQGLHGERGSRPNDRTKQVLASIATPSPQKLFAAPRHEIQFFSDEAILLDRSSRLIEAALEAGHAAVVCATKPLRDDLAHALQGRHLNVDDLLRRGNYVTLDAVETLSTLVSGESLDQVKFFEIFGGAVTCAADTARGSRARVALYQECAALLWAQGREEPAIQLERLFNELANRYDVDVLCGYSVTYFHGEEDKHAIQRLCAEHSFVNSE